MQTTRNTESESIVVEAASRRHRSKQERRQIAEESLQSGVSVAVVARHHGVNANQLFLWRKLLREGRLDVKPAAKQLMPVRIVDVVEEKLQLSRQQSGVIQIELGRVRVRVEGPADPATLRTILEQLGR
jgi:transposase